jgi:hypothetical protein
MTTTVRLPPRVQQALEAYCVENRRTKSEVIVELLEQRLLAESPETSPYEAAQAAGFIGCIEGKSDTAAKAKQLVAARIRAKHSR